MFDNYCKILMHDFSRIMNDNKVMRENFGILMTESYNK